MAKAARSNTTYVADYNDWIAYYDKKHTTSSFPTQPSVGIRRVSKVQQCKTIPRNGTQQQQQLQEACTTERDPDPKKEQLSEEDNPSNEKGKISTDMQDIELVSPVQGAVQQARADYARSSSIKRRRTKKGRFKKVTTRKRKQSRKKGRRKKAVKRLHKKKRTHKTKKKRKYRKKSKKRDIFNDH